MHRCIPHDDDAHNEIANDARSEDTDKENCYLGEEKKGFYSNWTWNCWTSENVNVGSSFPRQSTSMKNWNSHEENFSVSDSLSFQLKLIANSSLNLADVY